MGDRGTTTWSKDGGTLSTEAQCGLPSSLPSRQMPVKSRPRDSESGTNRRDPQPSTLKKTFISQPGSAVCWIKTLTTPERKRAAVEHTARPESIFGSLVHNLIERRENVVGELQLGDGCPAHRGETDPKSGDTLLSAYGDKFIRERRCRQSLTLLTVAY